MLQANCVAADMSAGMDGRAIRRHCIAAQRRSAFVRQAEETCAALGSHPGILLARDGQSTRPGGLVPPEGCLPR
jgi:hypothetical protein